MPRKTKETSLDLLQARTSTAPCVPAIRAEVAAWRARGYAGTTETTRRLLSFWFETDHRGGFRYHDAQREAMETIIYLWEAQRVRRQKELIQKFCVRQDLALLQSDEFTRYCIKMATGSGKTNVMALAVAWQFFNAVRGEEAGGGAAGDRTDEYASTFLLIAPNVIVFERLRSDFENKKIFQQCPVVPPEWVFHWDFQVYVRGESERASSLGALYLTNVQQLYERNEQAEPSPLDAVLGAAPVADRGPTFAQRIAQRGAPVMVLNDEAHHTHDEKLGWNEVIRSLNEQAPKGVAAQLDFTATPRHSKGNLFAWTVFDYPLKQAIIDNLVKMPIKGVTSGIEEQNSPLADVRYAAYLTAGVERWREYQAQLQPLQKKPILFVMMNDTKEADQIGHTLRTRYPEHFGGDKLLVIHTDSRGEVSKKDLDEARRLAREVDNLDNPINCIVSVMMLREGWDVQNVTVIVGLRPFNSKANILPEQAIGRGLRLMFRGSGDALENGYRERVDVIGNKKFIEFVEDLEREEDIQFETFKVGIDKLSINVVSVDTTKLDKDISLPILTPILERKSSLAQEIEALDVMSFGGGPLPLKESDAAAQNFRYEGFDILSMQKLVERDYEIPAVQTAEEVISYYAMHIMQDVKLPSQFAVVAPKVRQWLEHRAFGSTVDLSDASIVRAINSKIVRFVTIREFVKALRERILIEVEPQLLDAGRPLSHTPNFPWNRPILAASKCVFNLVPCDNEFERRFAKFLQNAEDIDRFSKIAPQCEFSIPYTDAAGNLRRYEPDFVAVASGAHWIVETKGMEDIHVQHKDGAAALWCENATQLTGTAWRYLKVPQSGFEDLQPSDFDEVRAAFAK